MATKLERDFYQIAPSGPSAVWSGRCPICGAVFTASGVSISQSQVISEIKRHQELVHGTRFK